MQCLLIVVNLSLVQYNISIHVTSWHSISPRLLFLHQWDLFLLLLLGWCGNGWFSHHLGWCKWLHCICERRTSRYDLRIRFRHGIRNSIKIWWIKSNIVHWHYGIEISAQKFKCIQKICEICMTFQACRTHDR